MGMAVYLECRQALPSQMILKVMIHTTESAFINNTEYAQLELLTEKASQDFLTA